MGEWLKPAPMPVVPQDTFSFLTGARTAPASRIQAHAIVARAARVCADGMAHTILLEFVVPFSTF
eukprot:jgi/Pico_ML_1/55959/g1564.t1